MKYVKRNENKEMRRRKNEKWRYYEIRNMLSVMQNTKRRKKMEKEKNENDNTMIYKIC